MDAQTICRTLGISDSNLAQTLARKYQTAPERLLICQKCSKKFRIKNAKTGGIYKCVACETVLVEPGPDIVQSIRAEDVELILDDDIPPEVKMAMTDSSNVFGRYVIAAMLGEGAMGAVHKAYDVELSRYVALKFIKSEQAEELRLEAKTLASLEHKNIARIYDVGSAKGKGFIAMQLIHGRRIEKWQDMIAVCEAVDYAHKRGIIHRDIKPDNILVDADGNVFVMDFGLASKNPRQDEIAGTPGFMPPEISGSVQGDVYSLAATLYYLLAGRVPLDIRDGDDLQTVLLKIRENQIISLQGQPPELTAIVMRALHKSDIRYPKSALELAQDLQRYIKGFPVTAFSSSVTYRARKAVKRNKALVTVIAAALLTVGIVSYAIWSKKDAETKKLQQAHELMVRGRKAIDESKIYLYRRVSDSELAREMERWRHEVEKGMSLIRDGVALVNDYPRESAEGYYLLGRGFHMMGDWKSAEQNYNAAIERNARHSSARVERGKLYLQEGLEVALTTKGKKWCAASSYLGRAIQDVTAAQQGEERADPAELQIVEAYMRLLNNKAEEAIRISRANLIDSTNEEFLLIIADAYYQTDAYKEALDYYSKAIERRPNFELALLRRGIVNSSAGKNEEAITDFTRVLKINPKNHHAFHWRGRAKAQCQDYSHALEDLNAATSLAPHYARPYIDIAMVKQSIGDTNGAMEAYDRAIKITPDDAQTYYDRATLKREIGDRDGSIDDCNHAIKIDRYYANAFLLRGWVERDKGDLAGALTDLNHTVELDDSSGAVYLIRGTIQSRMGKVAAAIDDFTRAIKLDPKLMDAHHFRGEAHMKTNEPGKAVDDFTNAIELDPRNGHLYGDRANALLESGDLIGAKADYIKWIDLEPANLSACVNCSSVMAELDDLQGTVTYATKAILIDPKCADAYFNRGRANFHLKNMNEAIDDFTKLLQIEPENADALLYRGNALGCVGKLQESHADCTKAIKLAPANWALRDDAEKLLQELERKLKKDY